jgi:hypothetical protein
MAEKDTMPVPKDGAEMTPHPGSAAAEEAKKLGLQYYGFGRYGKNGTVTHRSVHDKLVEVGPKVEEPKTNIPTAGTSMTKQPVKESLDAEFDDFLQEEKKVKLMRDKNGKVRTFMLRRAAAKEAHTHNGTVMPFKNGYVIKIKENEDAEGIIKPIQEQRSYTSFRQEGGRSQQPAISAVGTDRQTITEGATELTTGQEYQKDTGIETTPTQASGQAKTTTKITLSQIRSKQKEKGCSVSESIDKGTEPGLSMASGGENTDRGVDSKNKQKVKPLEELTGDETTMSTSDKKEDELKKVGIDLKSFKAKKFVG